MRALLLASLLALPASAVRPLNPPAPDFPEGAAWINATQLNLAQMKGRKAILVAFLNPTSINSVRSLPALQAWFDRYALHQLMVVGALTPDLEFQRDPLWTAALLKRYAVEFPVVLDGDRRLWKAYANEGWPTFYLIDHKGRVIFDRIGEGGRAELEKEIRAALGAFTDDRLLPPPVGLKEPGNRDCGPATPEITLGTRPRSREIVNLDKDFSLRRTFIVDSRQGETASMGRWDADADGLRLAQSNKDQSGFVRVVFRAAQALATMAPPGGGTSRVFVKLDDLWLHEGNAGGDILFDDDGRSFVTVDFPRLYDLVRDRGSQPHELYVIPEKKGLTLHGFSFSDSCVVTRLP